jgi:hypothetical protein
MTGAMSSFTDGDGPTQVTKIRQSPPVCGRAITPAADLLFILE